MPAFFAALISAFRSSLRPSQRSFLAWLNFSRRSGVQVDASFSRRSGVHGTLSRSDIIFEAFARRSSFHCEVTAEEILARVSVLRVFPLSEALILSRVASLSVRPWAAALIFARVSGSALLNSRPLFDRFSQRGDATAPSLRKAHSSHFLALSPSANTRRTSTTSGSPCSERNLATSKDDVKYDFHRSVGLHPAAHRAP